MGCITAVGLILYSASEQRRQAHLGRDETGVRRKIPPHALTIAGTQSWDLDEVVAEALKNLAEIFHF